MRQSPCQEHDARARDHGGVSMDKNVRIWIDGKLEVDASVPESELLLLSFSSLWQETVALASKRGQPWRVEFGDQDADVNDQHWAQPSDDGESRIAPPNQRGDPPCQSCP